MSSHKGPILIELIEWPFKSIFGRSESTKNDESDTDSKLDESSDDEQKPSTK